MREATLRWLSIADVIGLPAYILLFIWRWQFTARDAWIGFPIWLAASFLLHRDTPKSLGWRADNLKTAAKWDFVALVIMAAVLIAIGFALGQRPQVPPNFTSANRFFGYFAFCLLQQVALNSFLCNRFLSLFRRRWIAELFTGGIFAACHWPNPVLVPLTFIGGIVFAWLFAKHRNILPLAFIQAILGSIAWWSFPLAWHHNLRVGPGYYANWR